MRVPRRIRLGAILLAVPLWLAGTPLWGAPPAEDVYVLLFDEPPLAGYRGGVPGLAATHPEAAGTARLDPRGPASQAYLAWLERRQGERLDRIAVALGRRPEEIFRYRGLANGVALRLSRGEADRVRALPGVVDVIPDYVVPVDTDRGPVFIGAPTVWSGAALGSPFAGEGVIVGVIDTGVNMRHRSFSDAPVDGHVYVNPLGSGNFLGWCDPSHPSFDPSFVCNDKLIGAWDMADAVSPDSDGPEDSDGHGSHTASTAAGNLVDFNGDGVGDMSGVAPHASLITYDACYFDFGTGQGLCPFSATSAAADQAVLDGVDVINYSISGGTNPWSPSDIDRLFLNAVGAGIFVAASAGNSGPNPGTTGHLGPWVTTVAASQHDRNIVQNQLVNLSGGGGAPPANITGWSRSGGVGPAAIVYAAGYSNGDPNPEQCLHPFPPGTWNGQIVLCDRGTISRVLKGQNVLAGGAGGMVLANVSGGTAGLVDDAHILPAIHVDAAPGNALRSWLASGSGHMATITTGAAVLNPIAADILSAFSSRGPNPAFDVLKPDVANPGAGIYAAYRAGFLDEAGLPPYEGLEATLLSGTSMSSPHTAGSAALVRSAHPTWTPAEIKSALMTTATTDMRIHDAVTPANPFARGAGRVRFPEAVRAGLLLDESQADFLAAEPGLGGDPRALNLASLTHGACAGVCRWTRTVESALETAVTWTASGSGQAGMTFDVTPASFLLAPGGEQELTLEVGADGDDWMFGEITLTPDDGSVPPAHFPVAVFPIGAPELQFEAQQGFDTTLGNGNGVVEPFEVVELQVSLRNTGQQLATGVHGTLSSTTPGVTILELQANWPNIPVSQVGATDPPHFRVEIAGSVPCGTTLQFHLDVTTNEGPFPLDFQVPVGAGGPPALCEPVPCRVEAAGSVTPGTACSGETVTVSAAASLETGTDCSGTLEYRFEEGGVPLQDWSTDPDVDAVPGASLAYAVRVRDSATLTESLAFAPVEVFPLPAPTILQSPALQCVEVGTVELDAGPGLASYLWTDGVGQVIGMSSLLETDCSVPGPIDLVVVSADGCPGGASTGLNCGICTPAEVSPPGAAVPFRMGVDAAGTLEFEHSSAPDVTYTLYAAPSLAGLLAGDYSHKFCDLENNFAGTFQVVEAGKARWTPLAPSLIVPGLWVVIAERPPYVGSYGRSSLGMERPPDADGLGSVASIDCP